MEAEAQRLRALAKKLRQDRMRISVGHFFDDNINDIKFQETSKYGRYYFAVSESNNHSPVELIQGTFNHINIDLTDTYLEYSMVFIRTSGAKSDPYVFMYTIKPEIQIDCKYYFDDLTKA